MEQKLHNHYIIDKLFRDIIITSSTISTTSSLHHHLSDGHGAEDVEEDEGAVGWVAAHEVAVREVLEDGEWSERQLRHHVPVKPGVWGNGNET